MFGLDPETVTRFFLNCLMVVGGFVVGFIATALLAWGFDQWVSHRKSPPALHKIARWLGGFIVATIVGLYVFMGGKGTGGNGRDGGTTQSTSTGSGNTTTTAPTSPTPPSTKKAPSIQTHEIIRVTILGGFQAEEKYYVAEDDGQRQTDFAGIKSHIQSRKNAAEKPVIVEIHLAALNRTTRGNPVVSQLENWARNDERLSVSFPGDVP